MTCGTPPASAVARCATSCASRKARAASLSSIVKVASVWLVGRQFATKNSLGFGAQRGRVAVVARREVERFQPRDACRTRQAAGLAGGEVVPLARLVAIGVEE